MNLAELGETLRKARKAAGVSQLDLAKRRGMERATLSRIENGVVPEIGLRKFLSLCDALNLELTLGPKSGPPTLAVVLDKKRQEQQADANATDAMLNRLVK